MKYPCNLICDLIPLYIDEVCSTESRKIVDEHLCECDECRNYLNNMLNNEKKVDVVCDKFEQNLSDEKIKISSFKSLKKKILKKQIVSMVLGSIAVIIILFSTVVTLKNSIHTVIYENNISVSMVDGSLIGRLYGSEYEHLKIKRISIKENNEEKELLFYQIDSNRWSDLSIDNDVFSEYVICPSDKNADTIDAVYYYVGDYTNLDNIDNSELQKIIESSELLWEK